VIEEWRREFAHGSTVRSYSITNDAIGWTYQEYGHTFYVVYFPSANSSSSRLRRQRSATARCKTDHKSPSLPALLECPHAI
jgi:hypothetical protein